MRVKNAPAMFSVVGVQPEEGYAKTLQDTVTQMEKSVQTLTKSTPTVAEGDQVKTLGMPECILTFSRPARSSHLENFF